MVHSASVAYPAHYRTLEVDPGATPEVIHAAYRALVKKLDPRLVGEAGDQARVYNEAYEVLSDAAKRSEYDESGNRQAGKVIGNYRILEILAAGGFGTTYLAEHTISGMPVCVKHCHNISPASRQVLLDEARAVWDLRHFSLPVMRDLLELDDGSVALVMSYIPGPTLEQVVDKTGRVDAENVCWVTHRILGALQYLHYHGVVHGDIKPQNIIVQEERHAICLVDFGLAMVKPKSSDKAKGYTPIFAPPEQEAGNTLVPESDIYSLGMTMLYMLSGSTEHAAHLSVPDDVPDPLCGFVKRLLRREVLNRPSWASEDLLESLRKVRIESFGREHSNMKPLGAH